MKINLNLIKLIQMNRILIMESKIIILFQILVNIQIKNKYKNSKLK